jgi:hypothetical protein
VKTITAYDPENGSLRFDILQWSSHFDIDRESGVISTLDAVFDFESLNSSFEVAVVVSDGIAEPSPVVVFTVSLADVNEAPEFVGPSVGVVNETALGGVPVLKLSATDPEGDVLTYSLLQYDANFRVDAVTGEVTTAAKANLDHEASDEHTLGVVITDSEGASTFVEVNISVADLPEAPSFTGPMEVSLHENATDGSQVIVLEAADPENDTFVFELAGSSR